MTEYIDIDYAKIDEEAPVFNLPAYDPLTDSETEINLENLRWEWVVLFYYPADFTFVCPTELKDMMDVKSDFENLKVKVLAASTDTTFSHRAWVRHEKLMEWFPYLMLADHNWEVSDMYNIYDYKSWIAGRWTFVIDPDWILRSIEITSGPLWRNSSELIRKIRALQYMRENPGTACPAKWVLWDKTLSPSIKIAWEVFDQLNK
ncbi:MAG: hypothetical protein ACD_4C00189G0005 [uncultured bacterium (gcode 4)]|uniref:Thioredoxin domain-containing protein n=1 Tax=uncultured bacterium (gcode 4) TaxID=1234023 RepID=K2G988_9BACT|nr:MAG: hypothetical protein ACD_4C00189G0005 [uncultured bacterium (gcode 4)]